MNEIQDESRTWSGARNIKDFEISPDTKEQNQTLSQQKHSKRFKNCLTYLLVAAFTTIALILIFVILDINGRNPIQVYFQSFIPSKASEKEIFNPSIQKVTDGNSFMEKSVSSGYYSGSEKSDQFAQVQDSGHYQSVLELYMNRLFVTPLNKMSLTVPVNDRILRSYQVEAIDYSIDDEMVLYLSLGHQLKINNETMALYDKSMNVISHFPTYEDEEGTKKKDIKKESNDQKGNMENKLRNSENKRNLQQLQQHEYYNYTSTSEWNHKPEVVHNIIPTYYPRNPYVPPYGNPYYFAPNILVPYVYIY